MCVRACLTFLFFFALQNSAHAYPSFIGYGYSSCITCHYNGHGGGALNDYGRALFATEITARHIYAKETEEDVIAADSGFLKNYPLPWWVRPGIKYRGLWFQNSPGSQASSYDKFYNMQSDINLNFFADKKLNYGLITTAGYTVYPRRFSTGVEVKTPYWFAKEYYFRLQFIKSLWLYVGQLDRVFGLRQADHTSVNRRLTGFAQFDQSQGAVLHWTQPTWDIALNGFAGNASEKPELKQKGATISGEYEISEGFKVGASALSSKSEVLEWKAFSIHSRARVSKGTSLQFETGAYEKKVIPSAATPVLGAYGIIESLTLLRRGYNLLTVVQYAKTDVKKTGSENSSFSIGTLAFPLPRTEVRLLAVNEKTYNENSASEDSWQLQSQLHLSW